MAKDKYGRKLPKGIRQKDSGNFEGRLMYHGIAYSVSATSVTETKKNLEELKYQLEHGTYCKVSKISFEGWFKEWIETYKASSVKIGTINSYKKNYNAYLKDYLGRYQLADIRTEHLQGLLNDLQKEGYSDATIRIVCTIMSSMFKKAKKLGYISVNPYLDVEKPKGKEQAERIAFTREQEDIFYQYIKGSYIESLFALALKSGMRGGEVRGLVWKDVDFKNKIIHVRHNLVDVLGGGWYIDTPKNKYSVRDIPMSNEMYDILKRQRDYYDGFQYEDIKTVGGMDFVFFADTDNTPISRKRVDYEIKRILDDMELDGVDFPAFTLHTTRHTFATRWLENGGDAQVLQKILGHATLSMTTDLYGGHVFEKRKREEMEKIASCF